MKLHRGEKTGRQWPEGITNLEAYRMYLYDSESVEEKLEFYSLLLEDGDYEKYMPLIHEHTPQQKHAIQRQLVRWLWIRCRVAPFDSKEHHEYERMLSQQFDQLKP